MVDGDPDTRVTSASEAADRVERLPHRRAELEVSGRQPQQRVLVANRRLRVRRIASAMLLSAAIVVAFLFLEHSVQERREWDAYRSAIQASLGAIVANDDDEAKRLLQSAPKEHRHWEWNYLWHIANRVQYEGEPYRVNVGSWTGQSGIPLEGDDARLEPIWLLYSLTRLSPSGRFGMDLYREDGVVVDVTSGMKLTSLPRDTSREPWPNAWFGENDEVVSISRKGTVRFTNPTTGDQIRTVDLPAISGTNLEIAGFAVNTIAVSSGDRVRVFDLSDGMEIAALPQESGGLHLSPTGRHLLMHVLGEGEDPVGIPIIERFDLWDVYAPRLIGRYRCGNDTAVARAMFSPDGRFLLMNCGETVSDIWDTTTGVSVRRLSGLDRGADSIEFSKDGRYVATIGHFDDKIRLWEIGSVSRPRILGAGHQWTHANFSPDGRRIVGANIEGTITLWDVETGDRLLTLGDISADQMMWASFADDGVHLVAVSGQATQIRGWNDDANAAR